MRLLQCYATRNLLIFNTRTVATRLISKRPDHKGNSDGIWAHREMLKPPTHVWERRADTLRRVRRTIQEKYGKRYEVELFGSIRYGVASPESDLDLVILDPLRSNETVDLKSSNLPPIYKMRRLARVLQNAGFAHIETIPSANVPIVKFRDPQTNLHCDINVNDRLGLINSDLIRHYCDLSPLLRPMLSFIKLWAKSRRLNSPSAKGVSVSFSSYALVLMSIGFLQFRGLLPNLQSDLPRLTAGNTEGIVWIHRPKPQRCDIRYHRLKDYTPQANPTLSEVMDDWFDHWGTKYQYSKRLISIRHGGVVDHYGTGPCSLFVDDLPKDHTLAPQSIVLQNNASRKQGDHGDRKIQDEWKREPIRVIDPFIRTKNVTRNISLRTLERFQLECQQSGSTLRSGTNLFDLISSPSKDAIHS